MNRTALDSYNRCELGSNARYEATWALSAMVVHVHAFIDFVTLLGTHSCATQNYLGDGIDTKSNKNQQNSCITFDFCMPVSLVVQTDVSMYRPYVGIPIRQELP